MGGEGTRTPVRMPGRGRLLPESFADRTCSLACALAPAVGTMGAMESGQTASDGRARAILTPGIDLLFVGGLSLLGLVPLLFFASDPDLKSRMGEGVPLGVKTLTLVGLLQVLINAPHFMASYGLLYGSREQVRRYPWASIGVPAALVVYCAVAVALAGSHPGLVTALQGIAGGYLAWHYTGQAWGMMAVFSHVDGFMWAPRERGLIRLGLRLLLAWHVCWFFHIGGAPFGLGPVLEATRPIVDVLALASVPLGISAFVLLRRRTGRLPSARALAPWIAIHVWYLVLWRVGLVALVWVQLAHALQYLAFPARVELNRNPASSNARALLRLAIYAAVLVVAGVAVFELGPVALRGAARALGGEPGVATVAALLIASVNVHHYFTDGCVWKLSNPDVRRDLLSHLPRPSKPVAAPVAPPVA
jgi:hypothetical protein